MLTVVTAAASRDLTTTTKVKAEMKITSAADDAFIGGVVTEVSAQIAAHCDRVFAREEVSETLRLGHRQDTIALARWPVAEIVSVTVGGTALAAGDYETDAETGLLYRLDGDDRRACWHRGKVVVRYSAGYLLPGDQARDLPYDIEQAAIDLAKIRIFGRARDPALKSSDVDGVAAETYWVGDMPGQGESGMPETVEAKLAPYRRWSVG